MDKCFVAIAGLLISTGLGTSPLSAQRPQQSAPLAASYGAPLQVYRGSVANWSAVWIELADLGGGKFALTVLDGLTNATGAPEVFILQTNGRSGSGCRMQETSGADISFRQCPAGQAIELDAKLMGISSRVTMVPVGSGAAFGYGAKARTGSATAFDASCSMGRLGRADIFPSGGVARSGETFKQAVTGVRQQLADQEELDRLRSDRLGAINVLSYTSAELDQLAYIDSKINRIMDFRYRGPFIAQRQQLEQQFANRADRVAARSRLEQIDRRLAAIYDPSGQSRSGSAGNVAAFAGLLSTVDRAISQDIRDSGPMLAKRAIEVERALAEVDQCATLVGLTGYQFAAKRDLADQFARIASRLVDTLNSEIESGTSSAVLQARLQDYRASKGLMLALDNIGATDLLPSAEARVLTLANNEARQRDAAARQAAQAEARRRQASTAQQASRTASTAALAQAPRSAKGARGAGPTARQIRDALVYEQTYGRVTVGDAMGLAERSADYEAGISRMKSFGITFEVSFSVENPQCRSAGSGRFNCEYALSMNNSLGIPYAGRGAHTFELRDGIWRSPTYLAAIIEAGNRSAAGANNGRNCTVQGFGTPEGASIRDQNGLPC